MDTEQLIAKIASSKKKTPVKCYLTCKQPLVKENYPTLKIFKADSLYIIYGEYEEVNKLLLEYHIREENYEMETSCRYSAIPLLNPLTVNARIEPGAIIREDVEIEDHAVIMMGAVLNIGAHVGQGSMIDMNAVLGGRAFVGKNCHIGAGAVLAGVIEPASAKPVIVEDNVLVGANAVLLEGVHIGKDAVVAAGAVVIDDVLPGEVVGGVPARVLKKKDSQTENKTGFVDALRSL